MGQDRETENDRRRQRYNTARQLTVILHQATDAIPDAALSRRCDQMLAVIDAQIHILEPKPDDQAA